MHYSAKLKREGRNWLVEFPDCPGCQTFGASKAEALAQAADALEGWLQVHLDRKHAPPKPKFARGERVRVPVTLAVAIQIRWARDERGLTQADVAKLVGTTQQQIAKLETPKSNPTLLTLERVSKVLGTEFSAELAQ